MKQAEFKKVYETLANNKLLELYKEKHTLNPEAVPVLTGELARRGLLDKAESDLPERREPYHFASEEELENFINIRLLEGESLESIHLDLMDHGIDIKQKLHEQLSLERQIMEFQLNQMAGGKTEQEVRQDLVYNYGIPEEEIQRAQEKQKTKGNSYQLVGMGLIFLGLLTFMLFLSSDKIGEGMEIFITAISLCASGYISLKKHDALQK